MARKRKASSEMTTESLIKAMKAGTTDEKVETLRSIGVLMPDGTLGPKYQSWGNKPSRTPTADEMKEP